MMAAKAMLNITTVHKAAIWMQVLPLRSPIFINGKIWLVFRDSHHYASPDERNVSGKAKTALLVQALGIRGNHSKNMGSVHAACLGHSHA